jgi:acyl carrier protein
MGPGSAKLSTPSYAGPPDRIKIRMTRIEMLGIVSEVFREELDNDGLVLGEDTTAADVAEWDSLTHIQLVVAVEKRFNIRFASREIRGWANIGEMLDSIAAKIK